MCLKKNFCTFKMIFNTGFPLLVYGKYTNSMITHHWDQIPAIFHKKTKDDNIKIDDITVKT